MIFLLLLLSGMIIALQFPYVQTKLVHKATDYLSKTLKHPIKIGHIDISWFDMVRLKDISLLDIEHNQMIYLGETSIDFSIPSLFAQTITIDEVVLKDGAVHVILFGSDSTVNMSQFIYTIQDLLPEKESKGPSKAFKVERVKLDNMYFSYFDQRKDLIPQGFDHFHFSFDSIYADVTDLTVIADTFRIRVDDLTTRERQTGLRVHELDVDYLISRHSMVFDQLYARIGKSEVKDFLMFEFEHINDLAEFNELIEITTHLDKSLVYTQDLANFAPDLLPFEDYATISGTAKGKVINFSVKDLALHFGVASSIMGKVSFKGLPEVEETYVDFKFNKARIRTADLKQYFSAANYRTIGKFGNIQATGEYVGFPNDFVALGRFDTDLGKLETDINFKIAENEKPSALYSGQLTTYGFALGKFLDLPRLHKIDLEGKLEGKGLTLAEAEVNLDATIKSIGINNYYYKNIITNAKLSDELFDGFISIGDPNLDMTVNGLVDLKDEKSKFNIKANIHKANLRPINLSDRDIFLVSDVDLNFSGIEIDKITGEVLFTNTYLLFDENKEIKIDKLFSSSSKNDDIRSFDLRSDLLDMNASGNFEFTDLFADISTLWKEYELNFENNKLTLQNYYKDKVKKRPEPDKYKVKFRADIKDMNNIFNVYVPGLYLSDNVKIDGDLTYGYNSMLNIYTYIDTLFYNENELYHLDLELATSKLYDSAHVLAMFYANSPEQSFKGLPATENLFIEGIWDKGEIDFTGRLKEKNSKNNVKLNGLLSLESNKAKILELHNSSFTLLNKRWIISEENKIFFTEEGILFNNVAFSNQDEHIILNGMISDNPDRSARLQVSNFHIDILNPLLNDFKLHGTLNGDLVLRDIMNDVNLSGKITLDTLMVDNFIIGDITGESSWNNTLKRLDIKAEVNRDRERVIFIDGYMKNNPQEHTHDLNMIAQLNNARMELLNPLLEGVMSDISGTATGDIKISGTTDNVKLKGKADIKGGRFKIDYLGTTYAFEDQIQLDENLIGFKKLKVKDQFDNYAYVAGGIFHDGFKNFLMDIRSTMESFHMLNTTEKDNELFYGTAFVTGNMEILGAFENFEIKANAISNKGTKIYIPVSGYEARQPQDYIKFGKKGGVKSASSDVNLSGIKMDFNFDITPDAYAEIIFDKRAGDIIRGNGSGHIRMEIDTRGDFFMYGNYEIKKGAYNFTLANLINKEFKIQPGSTISWFGDPYQGDLDIKAIYKQSSMLAPILLDTNKRKQPEAMRRVPVDVHLGIKGQLLSPDIGLDIKIKQYPSIYAEEVTSFQNLLLTNEQELNRQVFSLLILGGFSSSMNNDPGYASPTSNLSELLTNQLGTWLSQVDDNLQIDMDLSGMDREALNTFNLRMSYTMLDGRLRISRDGNFTNVQNPEQTNISNIAGEWTIEYLLTPEGKLRLKLYNKNSQNQILNAQSPINTTTTSGGFSLLHTESFNNLQELFSKKKKKKAPQLEEPDFLQGVEEKEHEEEQQQDEEQDEMKMNKDKALPKEDEEPVNENEE